jgi:hypothetical protein
MVSKLIAPNPVLEGKKSNCKATLNRFDSIQLTARKSGLFFRFCVTD